jgi:hypothetical protein
MGNDPTPNIHQFAQWAVLPEQRDFRLAAITNLRDALDAAKDDPHLEDDEIEFCEGWLYLARMEIGDVSDDELDKQLVEKANAHMGTALLNG